MAGAVEFIVLLVIVMIGVLGIGGFLAFYLRKRAHARRIKRHFAAKVQTGRPTQS